MNGSIIISDLQIHLANGLGPSAFGLAKPPPCPLSLTVEMILEEGIISADEDTMLGLGVNYSSVSKAIYAILSDSSKTFKSPGEVSELVASIPLGLSAVQRVDIKMELTRAVLHAKSAVYTTSIDRTGVTFDRMMIKGMQVSCIIGLHPHEKAERQRLEVDIELGRWDERIGLKWITDLIFTFLENSNYGTLESLVHVLSNHVLSSISPEFGDINLELTIRKPSALPFGVPSVYLQRNSHPDHIRRRKPVITDHIPSNPSSSSSSRRIFIALGSNIGDRLSHFNRSISLLQDHGLTLVRTGRLYESEPMYVEDQDRFMNSAIEMRAPDGIDAMGILRVLKKVEKEVGRRKTFTNGPRVVDLDLIYYGDGIVKIGKKGDGEDEDGVGWLKVPHWGVGEREFVLRPLADIAPDFVDPRLRIPLRTLLSRLPRASPPQLAPLLPFPYPASPLRLNTSPQIMAIINATPDSFSDGSLSNLSIPHVISSLREMFSKPHAPHIIDIGGMSTRPNSTPCSEEEELERVIPLIKAIRALGDSDPILRVIPISIDTYRPSVARAAIEAGASCINDVRGGREEGMMEVMAEMDVPVVLMHSRGDSISMTTSTLQDYSDLGGVVEGVKKELRDTVAAAEKAGIKRWNIILDPGLGFAKSSNDNLVLLRRIGELTSPGSGLEGFPVLVGGSRKGFVGKAIGREVASERGYGDAGVLSWCATSGSVGIVRVHDARAAGEVLAMMSAIRNA